VNEPGSRLTCRSSRGRRRRAIRGRWPTTGVRLRSIVPFGRRRRGSVGRPYPPGVSGDSRCRCCRVIGGEEVDLSTGTLWARTRRRRRTFAAGRGRPVLQQAWRLDRARRRARKHAAEGEQLADRGGRARLSRGQMVRQVRRRRLQVRGGKAVQQIEFCLSLARARAGAKAGRVGRGRDDGEGRSTRPPRPAHLVHSSTSHPSRPDTPSPPPSMSESITLHSAFLSEGPGRCHVPFEPPARPAAAAPIPAS
jgi:hypothetical protein